VPNPRASGVAPLVKMAEIGVISSSFGNATPSGILLAVLTEHRCSIEDEGDEELTGREFRIIEARPSRVRGFPAAAATSNTVGVVEGVEAVSTAVRTGPCFPNGLNPPPDDGFERLDPKFLLRSVPQVLLASYSANEWLKPS